MDTDMNLTVLAIAFISLFLGVSIYTWIGTRKNVSHFYTTSLICWLLIALFPVLLIFSLFPNSSISGTVKGVSVGGAIGAFIIIWMYGSRSSLKARSIDEKIQALGDALESKKKQIEKLEAQVSEDSGAPPYDSPLVESKVIAYRFKTNKQRRIILITGNIRDVRQVDVWVNSENTNMQMSRFYESSISGIIRYDGAEKDNFGNVIKDLIGDELRQRMAGQLSVHPGSVLVTSPGNLYQTNNVKKIFHVASVQGEVGYGYHPINDIGRCVKNCLDEMDSQNMKGERLQSIILPLLGTGKAGGDLKAIASKLIQMSILALGVSTNISLKDIYFLTWTNLELEVCKAILDESEQLEAGA
jgi:O-acetyl-ADP-ribose deacetylase (regulator of RNase III)